MESPTNKAESMGDLLDAWDRLARHIERVETSLPQGMTAAVLEMEKERIRFAATLQDFVLRLPTGSPLFSPKGSDHD